MRNVNMKPDIRCGRVSHLLAFIALLSYLGKTNAYIYECDIALYKNGLALITDTSSGQTKAKIAYKAMMKAKLSRDDEAVSKNTNGTFKKFDISTVQFCTFHHNSCADGNIVGHSYIFVDIKNTSERTYVNKNKKGETVSSITQQGFAYFIKNTNDRAASVNLSTTVRDSREKVANFISKTCPSYNKTVISINNDDDPVCVQITDKKEDIKITESRTLKQAKIFVQNHIEKKRLQIKADNVPNPDNPKKPIITHPEEPAYLNLYSDNIEIVSDMIGTVQAVVEKDQSTGAPSQRQFCRIILTLIRTRDVEAYRGDKKIEELPSDEVNGGGITSFSAAMQTSSFKNDGDDLQDMELDGDDSDLSFHATQSNNGLRDNDTENDSNGTGGTDNTGESGYSVPSFTSTMNHRVLIAI